MHLFHKWSKWEDKRTDVLKAMDTRLPMDKFKDYAYLDSIETRQERRCEVCNILQRRKVAA